MLAAVRVRNAVLLPLGTLPIPIGKTFSHALNQSITEPIMDYYMISPDTAKMIEIVEMYERNVRKSSVVIK